MRGSPRVPVRMMRRGWLRLPRRTVRLQLTMVYGGLFLLSGTALLGITYLLVSQHLPRGPVTGGASIGTPPPPRVASGAKVFVPARNGPGALLTGPVGTPAQL